MVYTTEQLIKILADERHACLQGQRLKIAKKTSGNPVIDKLIKGEGAQKFNAYQDFKAAVHAYQQEHRVSGIVWRQLTLKGKTLRYPEIDSQLIALPEDLETLRVFKRTVISFWQEVTANMDLFMSVRNGIEYRLVMPTDVDRINQRTEWASLCKWEKANFLEIVLQLGWGQPAEAAYRRGWPVSGSEYIHAVIPGNLPIG